MEDTKDLEKKILDNIEQIGDGSEKKFLWFGKEYKTKKGIRNFQRSKAGKKLLTEKVEE